MKKLSLYLVLKAAIDAAVVESADTRDLKSLAHKAYRFKSGQRHQTVQIRTSNSFIL